MKEINAGIIGFGNMGSAIYERMKRICSFQIYDKEITRTYGVPSVDVARAMDDLLKKSDVIILAVKPQDFEDVLGHIKFDIQEKLIISIAAGTTTGYIEKRLGDTQVIRVMPNIAAKIGKGMSCLCKGKTATTWNLNLAERLFKELGETLVISEEMMDAATAVSGSGPGYFFYLAQGKQQAELESYIETFFIPQLTAAALSVGFNPGQAKVLATTTAKGSMALLKETGLSPEALWAQVASKGGTTEAGLEVLRNKGSLEEAVKAAARRAAELSRR
jgi:pyrroline-5-carboxylate reductase